ncbi:hypothetical protein GD1_23 [Paraglaciecola Antarctic GD virus 1]|nr:hypothetical protein GD1_23 [Paraglaciecola Antarctic GD virus 1]
MSTEEKTGIFISKIDKDHVWLIYIHNGVKVWEQPMARTFRDYLEPAYQQDVKNGDVAKGFRPEFAFGAVALGNAIDKEMKKA